MIAGATVRWIATQIFTLAVAELEARWARLLTGAEGADFTRFAGPGAPATV